MTPAADKEPVVTPVTNDQPLTPASAAAAVPAVAGLENPPSLPNKMYDYILDKGMSRSYIGAAASALPISQTLLAEFLKKKNVTIPSPMATAPASSSSKNRLVDEIDLTRNEARRRSRQGAKDVDSGERSKSGSREQAAIGSLPLPSADYKKPLPPPPSFPGGFPPLSMVFPPLPPPSSSSSSSSTSISTHDKLAPAVISSGDAKKLHAAVRKPDTRKLPVGQQHWSSLSPLKMLPGQPPLPPGPPLPPPSSSGRVPKSLMSLPLPQPSNDNDDLISYSPTSPITPPPKTAKKGIMDLPLPPGKSGQPLGGIVYIRVCLLYFVVRVRVRNVFGGGGLRNITLRIQRVPP